MKKLFVVLAILFPTSSLHAQFSQGRILIGGSLGVDFSKRLDKDNNNTSELYRSTTFAFEPSFGYFIVNRFALGAGVTMSNTRIETKGGSVTTRDETTFNPLFRYYLPTKVFFQLKIPVGVSHTSFDNGSGTSRTTNNVSGIALGVGYAIMLNNHVALEPVFQFSSKTYNSKNSADREVEKAFNFRMGFQIYLGK